jgi:hypothetical protein
MLYILSNAHLNMLTLYTIAENDRIKSKAFAVYLKDMDSHLKDFTTANHKDMRTTCKNFYNFFKTQGQDILQKGWKC